MRVEVEVGGPFTNRVAVGASGIITAEQPLERELVQSDLKRGSVTHGSAQELYGDEG